MRPKVRAPLLVLILLLLASCAPRSEIRSAQQISEVRPPEFRLVQGATRVERFDPPGAGGTVEIAVGTSIQNPNDFAVRLTEIEYRILLEDRIVQRGTLQPDTFLAPGAVAPLSFEVETQLDDRPNLLRSVVRTFAGDPLDFRIEGRLRFNSLAYEYRTTRKVLVEGSTLSRETVVAPQLRLVEAESQAYLLNPELPVVRLVLSVSNPGDIGYFLYGKDLRLALGDHHVTTDDLRPVPVPAGSSTSVDVIFYPQRDDLSDEAAAALEAALGGIPTSVELSGSLAMDVLGVATFPVTEPWQVVGFIRSP